MRKKLLSGILALIMSLSCFSNIVFAENDETITTDQVTSTEVASIDKEVDYTESYDMSDTSANSQGYSVTDIRLAEEEMKITADYTVINDAVLKIKVYDEDSSVVYDTISTNIKASLNSIEVPCKLESWPQYFSIDAEIYDASGTTKLSDKLTLGEHTRSYEEFMNITSDNAMFEGQVILDYGESADGEENFAVVRSGVEVVYVDSMDDLKITDTNGDVVGDVALMSEDEEVELYSFSGVTNGSELETALDNISVGEKVLIVPRDDINQAVALKVDEKTEIELFNEDASNVTLAADVDVEFTEDDLFDFIKIDMDIAVDENDIIPAEGVVAAEDEEEVELFGFLWDGIDKENSYSKGKTYTIYSNGSTKVTDTLTLTGTFKFSLHFVSQRVTVTYQILWKTFTRTKTEHRLGDITASVTVSVTNVLNLKMAKDHKINKEFTVGNLYKKSFFKVVEIAVPLTISFEGKANALLTTTLTQKAGGTFGVTYNGSRATPIIRSNGFSSEYDFTVKGHVEADLGVGIGVDVKAPYVKANVDGTAGVTADGNCGNGKVSGSTRHDCEFCIDGVINWYLKGSAKLVFDGDTIANPTFGKRTGKIADFYASFDADRSPNWKCGKGDCSNKSYKVVVTTKNSKTNKVLKGATVKYGSNTIGKSNSDGKVTGWLKPGTYKFKATKSDFNSATAKKKVGVSGLNLTLKLTPKGAANEEYYYIDDIFALNDEEYAEFITDEEFVANCLFLIRNSEDLQNLSILVNNTERDIDKLRFVMNNASGTIDMTGVEWTPIGTADRPFMSEFDGNKMTITGLSVDSESDYVGLFGNVKDAEIFDLGVTNASVSGNNYVGIIAGNISGNSKVYDTYVTGSVNGNNNVGALIGSVDKVEVLNTYSTADVSGNSNVGGLVGTLNHSTTTGQLTNSYSVGTVTGSSNVGGVAGVVTYEAVAVVEDTTTDETEEVIEDIAMSGVQYCYYLDAGAENAVGTQGENVTVIAYPVSEAQATGVGSEELISFESEIANTYTLLDALNSWYTVFGMNSAVADETDDSTNMEDTTTEDEDESTLVLQTTDPYNQWFEDESLVNGGYPLFEEKGEVYTLTVEYVFEDGTEAKPSVVLYLEEGQEYDVDSYSIDNYYTDEIEYSGVMPAGDTFFRVLYRKIPMDVAVTELYADYVADGTQAQKGSVCNLFTPDDVIALANYVSAGGNTEGVIFSQESDINLDGVTVTPIGTADKPFKGTYNSNAYSISNLKIYAETDNIGFFGYTNGATINNPYFIGANVTGKDNVGALIGYAENTVVNSANINATMTGNQYVGGVVGYAKKSTINGTFNSGSMLTVIYSGGLVGMLDESTLMNCENFITIEAMEPYAGGIAGYTNNSTIVNSYNMANVSGVSYVGGVTGKSVNSTIENVYSVGTVTGTSVTAGFIGEIDNEVKSCYYMNYDNPVASGSTNGLTKMASAPIMMSLLNNWVTDKASSKYYEWLEDEGYEYPVLGTSMTNWVTDFEFVDSNLSLNYNAAVESNGILYVASYDKDGRLVTCNSYTTSGSYSIPITSSVTRAKAFIWDSNLVPLDTNIEILR